MRSYPLAPALILVLMAAASLLYLPVVCGIVRATAELRSIPGGAIMWSSPWRILLPCMETVRSSPGAGRVAFLPKRGQGLPVPGR